MKLSMITPVYNGADFLIGLVDAVQHQILSDWELILVDDGSTDDSPGICDEMAAQNSRIRAIHKRNGGVSSARNAGLAVAKGEWIGFVDCDDYPKPEMYARLISAVEQNKCDFAMGGYEKVSDTNVVSVSVYHNGLLQKSQIKEIIYSMAFWNAYLNGKPLHTRYGSVWPNVYRADIIRTNAIRFPEQISLGEDLLFNLSYLRYVQKAVLVDQPLYRYNIANQSATRKQNPFLWENYVRLGKQVSSILISEYGEEEELQYNIQRQYINYAINVAEEQICLFLKGSKMRKALRELCSEDVLQKAAFYVEKYGRNKKEKMQARLIHNKQANLLSMWLDKR